MRCFSKDLPVTIPPSCRIRAVPEEQICLQALFQSNFERRPNYTELWRYPFLTDALDPTEAGSPASNPSMPSPAASSGQLLREVLAILQPPVPSTSQAQTQNRQPSPPPGFPFPCRHPESGESLGIRDSLFAEALLNILPLS